MNSKLKILGFGLIGAALIAASLAAAGLCQFDPINRMHAGRLLGTANALLIHIVNERIGHNETVASSMATNPGFVGYVAATLNADPTAGQSVDVASIRDLLEERRRETGLSAAAALDSNGKAIVATGNAFLSGSDKATLALVNEAKKTSLPASAMISDGNRMHIVTITPLSRSGVDALLLTAEKFDETSLRSISGISNAELALIAYSGEAPRILAATLDAADAQGLADAAEARKSEWVAHGAARDPNQERLTLAGQSWTAQVFPVPRTAGSALLVALIAPSYSSALTSALWPPLAATASGAIVLLALLLVLHWRGTLGPIVAMTALAERAQRGDYALSFKAPGAGLAARLAKTLNQILGQLDRYRAPPGTPRRRATDTR